jgi:hypothetical protein
MIRTLRAASPVLVAVAVLAAPAVGRAAPGGYQVALSGSAPGGSWELAVDPDERLESLRGMCLDLSCSRAADGAGGNGNACTFGSLRAADDVVPVRTTMVEGGQPVANVIGGITRAAARRVRLTTADGHVLRLPTRRVASVPRLLGARVRFFGGDLFHLTPSAGLRRIELFDRPGRRIASRRF